MEIRTKTIIRLRDALLASGSRKSAVVSSAYRALAREGLLTKEEDDAIARVEGAAEAMFLVIAADEQVMDTELAALRGAIRGLTGDALNDEIVQVMMENFAVRLRDDGRSARLAAVAASMKEREEAINTFSLCAAVALADEKIDDAESALIQELREVFGLSQADAESVLGQLAEDAD